MNNAEAEVESELLTVTITQGDKRRLKALAAKEGVSMRALVRTWIRDMRRQMMKRPEPDQPCLNSSCGHPFTSHYLRYDGGQGCASCDMSSAVCTGFAVLYEPSASASTERASVPTSDTLRDNATDALSNAAEAGFAATGLGINGRPVATRWTQPCAFCGHSRANHLGGAGICSGGAGCKYGCTAYEEPRARAQARPEDEAGVLPA